MRHLLLAGIALTVMTGSQAVAVPITGSSSFDLMGNLRASSASTFDQADGFDFGVVNGTTITYGTPGGTVTLGGAVNAVYTAEGFTPGLAGNVVDIASGNLTTGTKNITGFYSFISSSGNSLSFDLSTITLINRIAANPSMAVSPTINVYGTGVLNLTGYDPTPGVFSLSTSNTGTGLTATFQSSVISGATVPEPASLTLLGLGAAGVLAARRRRARG